MNVTKSSICLLFITTICDGCFTPPVYPIEPKIEILNEEMYYTKSNDVEKSDTLVVAFRVMDGDGDVGLDDSYNKISTFVQQRFFYIDASGVKSEATLETSNVTYRFKKQFPQYRLPDYNCKSWEFKRNSSSQVVDTVYTELNDNFYNFFVEYYFKEDKTGAFTLYDIYKNATSSCPDRSFIAGRIPVLALDAGKSSPIDGVIRYKLSIPGLEAFFGTKICKMKIQIQDRSLHKSNSVETKEFTLAAIRK